MHMRKPLVVTIVGVIATACSQMGGSHAGDIRPVPLPVVARSMSTIYGIQVDLRGSATIRDGWVYVNIPTGAARTYQGRASAWDLFVRAGVGTCSADGHGILIAEGRAARLAPVIGLSRDNDQLDTIPRTLTMPLQLDVGIPPGTDLNRSWLTIDVAWPIEAAIASYSLTSTGVLTSAAPDQAVRSEHAKGNRPQAQSPILEMDELHAPAADAHCRPAG